MTQTEIIKRVLKDHGDWLPGWSFVRVDTDYGFLPERASRTLREMARAGTVEKKLIEGEVWYRLPNGHSALFNELQQLKIERERFPVVSQQKLNI